ncbi:MAG TPA: hypothetical protein VFX76_19795, partial [Roseiflexaceae bacterium]|nr:hypothetical protein [Roseiflexaceae bacterium]
MRLLVLFVVLLLVACGEVVVPAPEVPATPTRVAFTPISDLQQRSLPPTGVSITTVGYVVVTDASAILLDGLTFSEGATPQPLSSASVQIWLGGQIIRSLGGFLQRAGTVRYAIVVARGKLEGPGLFGPNGSYRYRLSEPSLQTVAPEDTNIAALLDGSNAYEGRVVRVAGNLLARPSEAVLVEQLGPGGLPEPNVRQLKLHGPLRDQPLL